MVTLTWMFARNAANVAVAATVAAGITSVLLTFTTRRSSSHACPKASKVERRVANLVGEVSALRDESELRWDMQRIWANDRDQAAMLFGPLGDPDGR